MILGFTGSRKGMTARQFSTFAARLAARPWERLVHGSAYGADQMAHYVALALRVPVHLRPCALVDQVAPCPGAVLVHPARPPLYRNLDIVVECALLVACPSGPEHRRSGTWSTVRAAREQGRRVVLVLPDGSVGMA